MVYEAGNDGHELRRRRRKLHLSQAALAKQAGVSRVTVSNIERDSDSAKMRTVRKIRETLERFEKK